ncbi:aldose 1-epimerase [Acidianus sulfidivorans JP7]|uniref:Aldose 1-epimerase n=1 Tax=Acidianus sulfidivorans JP7 TaxID=619593 RepID=A0A2U9IQM0_9CREN|nr:aldose 1-epimerase [Acidianus sulfidivorans]AWR98339.1 aldose 1-epimerase [Acidianus sulfidivorans JP7]
MRIANQDTVAEIMESGAYLYSFKKNNKDIILKGNEQRRTHGGMALLIPYANRVKNAEYIWEGKKYELPKNKEGNSIHGLILDKQFSVIEKSENYVTLEYLLDHPGYPSKLYIKVTYSIDQEGLETKIFIENKGGIKSPLVVGAHPYFIVKGEWKITPSKVSKCILENKIPTGKIEEYNIIQRDYDDCFIIPSNVTLESEYSRIEIVKDENLKFVQIYTGEPNAVAVEPMSGAPDAYHNNLGLIVIKPKEIKEFYFKIKVNI